MKKGKLGLLVVSLLTLSGLAGCAGAEGPAGLDGKSAYDLAVAAGFEGTLEEWLAALKGDKGDKGETGAPGLPGKNGKDGEDGEDGAAGKSAYEIAKENGFEGTEEEWLASLKGADGQNGTNGTDGDDGEDGEDGAAGKSAYEIAKENGFEGTEEEWLASLAGADGENGQNGQNGRGIANVTTNTVVREGVEYLVITITFDDGSDPVVQEIPLGQVEYGFSTYHCSGLDEEKHPILVRDNPVGDPAVDTIVSDLVLLGAVEIKDNAEEYSDYVTVTQGSTQNFVWKEGNAYFESSNHNVGSTNATMSFEALFDGVLELDVFVKGETNYDYLQSAIQGDAKMTEGKNNGEAFKSSDITAHHKYEMKAGSKITYTYRKDGGVNTEPDVARLSNIKFSTSAIEKSADDVAVVNFDANGGSLIAPIAVEKGKTLAELPAEPVLKDKAFAGWFTNKSMLKEADLTAPITADMTVIAKWVDPIYVVTDVEGEEEIHMMAAGATLTLEDPHKDGYTFDGWFTSEDFDEETAWTNGSAVLESMMLYAKFTEIRGYSFEKPFVLDAIGDEGVTLNIETIDAADYGKTYYVEYTAPAAEIITMKMANETRVSGDYGGSKQAKFYDAAGNELGDTLSGGKNAANDIKKVGVLTTGTDSFTKIHLEANEKIIIAYTLGSGNYNVYGTADMIFNRLGTEQYEDYTLAHAFELEENVSLTKTSTGTVSWFSFTPEETKSYWLSVGGSAYSYIGVGTLAEGDESLEYTSVLGNLGGTDTNPGAKGINLEAGVTYYFTMTVNSANTTGKFKLSADVPVGAAEGNPLEVEVGAEPVDLSYVGVDKHYAKFTVGHAGTYEIRLTYSSAAPALFANADFATDQVTLTDSFDAGDNAIAKFAQLEAGDYYLRTTTSSYASSNKLSVVELAAGATTDSARTFEWIDGDNEFRVGEYYTFTSQDGDKINLTVPAGAKAEFYKIKPASTSYYNPSPASLQTIATIDATESETAVKQAVTFEQYKKTYVKVTAGEEVETVNILKEAFIGPLTGAAFLGQQFNGTRDGNLYYKIIYGSDFVTVESTKYEITSVERDGDNYIVDTSFATFHTDGETTIAIAKSGGYVYCCTSRNSTYSSGAYGAILRKTSGFTATSGTLIHRLKGDDGNFFYTVYMDGKAYFDVELTFEAGEEINDSDSVFTFSVGGKYYRSAYSTSLYNTVEEIEAPTPADPEPEPQENMYALTVAIAEDFAAAYGDSGAVTYIYAYKEGTEDHVWIALEDGMATIDTSLYDHFNVVRMNPAAAEPSWGEGVAWNQTPAMAIDAEKTTITITGFGEGSNLLCNYL